MKSTKTKSQQMLYGAVGFIALLVLGFSALAVSVYQQQNTGTVAPNAPDSNPQAAYTVNSCALTFQANATQATPTPTPQTCTPGTLVDVAIVVDHSGSMVRNNNEKDSYVIGGNNDPDGNGVPFRVRKLWLAREAIKKVSNDLLTSNAYPKDSVRVGLAEFASCKWFSDKKGKANQNNILSNLVNSDGLAQLTNRTNQIDVEGVPADWSQAVTNKYGPDLYQTCVEQALQDGKSLLTTARGARPDSKKFLILITDGKPTQANSGIGNGATGGVPAGTYARIVRETMDEVTEIVNRNIKVYAVGIGPDSNEFDSTLMKCIAGTTDSQDNYEGANCYKGRGVKGEYLTAAKEEDIEPLIRQIGAEIQTSTCKAAAYRSPRMR